MNFIEFIKFINSTGYPHRCSPRRLVLGTGSGSVHTRRVPHFRAPFHPQQRSWQVSFCFYKTFWNKRIFGRVKIKKLSRLETLVLAFVFIIVDVPRFLRRWHSFSFALFLSWWFDNIVVAVCYPLLDIISLARQADHNTSPQLNQFSFRSPNPLDYQCSLSVSGLGGIPAALLFSRSRLDFRL